MSEDVTITLEAAVVRLSALEVRSLLRMQQQTRRWGELQAANPWAYNIWETGSKVGALQARAVLYCPPPAYAVVGSAASPTSLSMLWEAVLCSAGHAHRRPQLGFTPGWPATRDPCHGKQCGWFSSSAHALSAHQAVLV